MGLIFTVLVGAYLNKGHFAALFVA